MTLNIFYGGDDYDLATGDWCPVADGCPTGLHRLARIIARERRRRRRVQEAERNTRRLAGLLGWHAEPARARDLALPDPATRPAATGSTPSSSRCRAGSSRSPTPTCRPRRTAPTRCARAGRATRCWSSSSGCGCRPAPRCCACCRGWRRAGIPVFLTGDFNSPSYLDWTPAVARRPRGRAVPRPLAGQQGAGGRRLRATPTATLHPDPVADPGFTWSPGGPETRPHDVFDRIDWVLHAGPATTVSSRLVGETGQPPGRPGVRRTVPHRPPRRGLHLRGRAPGRRRRCVSPRRDA